MQKGAPKHRFFVPLPFPPLPSTFVTSGDAMAQGKLKVKAKSNSSLAKKGNSKSAGAIKRKVGVTKKGAKAVQPKKGAVQQIHKVQKAIQKGIHQVGRKGIKAAREKESPSCPVRFMRDGSAWLQ